MKKMTIAGAASFLALSAFSPFALAPLAMAQTSTGDATTSTPGVTGQPAPTPGVVPPAGGTDAAKTDTQTKAATADTAPASVSTDGNSSNAGGPAKGSNSFTESQAQGRIADAGYSSVTGLKKDGDGIWRGSAMKDGQQVSVWLDYTGQVGKS